MESLPYPRRSGSGCGSIVFQLLLHGYRLEHMFVELPAHLMCGGRMVRVVAHCLQLLMHMNTQTRDRWVWPVGIGICWAGCGEGISGCADLQVDVVSGCGGLQVGVVSGCGDLQVVSG